MLSVLLRVPHWHHSSDKDRNWQSRTIRQMITEILPCTTIRKKGYQIMSTDMVSCRVIVYSSAPSEKVLGYVEPVFCR